MTFRRGESANVNSSYFFDVDRIYGWGNRSYFSFFSEFNRSSAALGYIEAFIFFVLIIVSMVGNITVFAQLVYNKRLRNVTNCFICNLTIADVFFSFGCPFIAITRITEAWNFGSSVCSMVAYLELVCGFVDIWTMALISIDRYICIVRRSRFRLTTRSACVTLVVVWVLAFVSFTPLAMYFKVIDVPFGNTRVSICTLIWPKRSKVRISIVFTCIICLCGFVVPLSLLTWNYTQIFRKFWKIRCVMVHTHSNISALWTRSLNMRKRRNIRDFKIVKTLFLLVLLFFLMWSPIFIAIILILYDGQVESNRIMSSQLFIAALVIAMGNACVNPLFYGFMMEKLRSRLRLCITCSRPGRREPDNAERNNNVHIISAGVSSDPQRQQ